MYQGHALDDGQPQSVAGKVSGRVQAIKAHAVVSHHQNPFADRFAGLHPDLDPRFGLFRGEFPGVFQQTAQGRCQKIFMPYQQQATGHFNGDIAGRIALAQHGNQQLADQGEANRLDGTVAQRQLRQGSHVVTRRASWLMRA